MAQYIHKGETIDYTPSTDVTAGDVVVIGDLIGVANRSIPANRLGGLTIEGVFEFAKEAAAADKAIAAGVKLYWNATEKRVELTDGSGTRKYLGKSVKAALTTDETVWAKLGQ